MNKLGRNYQLTISGTNIPGQLKIAPPFTIEFDIIRNTLSSTNVASIRLYNLSKLNRNYLLKNEFNYDYPLLDVVLAAGYGSNLAVIFSGNIQRAWSVREGINFITQMECYDGGFAFINGQTDNLTVPKGTAYQKIIADLITSLPDVTPGYIGTFPGVTPKDITLDGNTVELLRQYTGMGFFIDQGVGNALNNNEYIISNGETAQINASTGLLNTPVVENTLIRFEMIFEPLLQIGDLVNLQSSTLQISTQTQVPNNFSGNYKCTAVHHKAMISPVVCGDAITMAELQGMKAPIGVPRYGG